MECIAEDILCNVSIHVLENHAFIFPEREELDASYAAGSELLRARVRFRGAVSGELALCVPCGLANEIAADILGVDPGAGEAAALIKDAVGELANVLCGNVLTASAVKDQVLDFAAPQVDSMSACEWKTMSETEQTVELSVDDHRLLIHFHFD